MSTVAPRPRLLPVAMPWQQERDWPVGARSWLVSAVSLVLAITVMYSRYLYTDSYYDLYAGRYIVRHGIPRSNVITAAAHGAPWIDQQWLAHLAFYGTWAAGGYPALGALSAVLVTAGFAVLALLMLSRGVPPSRMFLWTIAAYGACAGSTWIQAQSFGYLFFALTLWLILADGLAHGPRPRTWLVLPLLVLWANTHGSVLLGAGLVIVYAGYRVALVIRLDRPAMLAYLALAAGAAAAVVCTPYGVGVLGYYRSLIGNPVLSRYVMTWQPPTPLNPFSWAFFTLAVIVLTAVVLTWRRGIRPDPLLLGLACLLLALALTAFRNQVWFALGGSLLAADTVARGGGRGRTVSSGLTRGATAACLAALAMVSVALLTTTAVSQFESLAPVRSVAASAALAGRHPSLRILGDDWSSSAMLWLHPAAAGRVGFDARLEQYPDRQLAGYIRFVYRQGPGWQHIMRTYGIVVVSRGQHPQLARALTRLPGWRVVYQDRDGLVLMRQPGTAPSSAR